MILASTGPGCDHIDHVKTQLPYALLNAGVSLVAYVIAGITDSPAVFLFNILFIVVPLG